MVVSSMARGFFESHVFSRKMDKIDSLELCIQIEETLSENPKAGNVIPGLGGIRKVRIGNLGSGKRGGFRIIYLDLASVGRIYLLTIYGKKEKIDLTIEDKRVLKKLADEVKRR
jgi:hypothetical protein